MNEYHVQYIEEETIERLKNVGKIKYHSPVMKIAFVKTNIAVEMLRNIEGVKKVELKKVGRIHVNKMEG